MRPTGSGLARRRERRSLASERAPSPSVSSRPAACAGVFHARRALAKRRSSIPAAALRAAIPIPSVSRFDEGAEVEATTPSAERIYRSDGPAASVATRLVLKPGARLFWLPQETLMFEGARLERRLELDTSGEAAFIVAETLVFGRLAMGESRIDATLRDSWRVRRDGRLVFADETRIGACWRDARAQGGRGGGPRSVDDRRVGAQY